MYIIGVVSSNRYDAGLFRRKPQMKTSRNATVEVERVQTGVRLEKRLLKVLKGLAEYLDVSLGDLLEGIALHGLENKPPFAPPTLKKIIDLKRVYGLELGADDSHRLRER